MTDDAVTALAKVLRTVFPEARTVIGALNEAGFQITPIQPPADTQGDSPWERGYRTCLADQAAQGLRVVPANSFVLPGDAINDLQYVTLHRSIVKAKAAHMVDLVIRIGGRDDHEQADWLKHLDPPAAAPKGETP